MRRRQLLALSALAPLALVACSRAEDEAPSAATTFSYSPEGYEGLTVELDRPVERIAMDFYSAAALAPTASPP